MVIYNKIVLSSEAPKDKYVVWVDTASERYSINMYLLGKWTPINVEGGNSNLIHAEIKGYITELQKDLAILLDNKVDKEEGKGLSSVDVTDEMVLNWNLRIDQSIETANQSKTIVELLRELVEILANKKIDTDDIKDGAVTYSKININVIADIEDLESF